MIEGLAGFVCKFAKRRPLCIKRNWEKSDRGSQAMLEGCQRSCGIKLSPSIKTLLEWIGRKSEEKGRK